MSTLNMLTLDIHIIHLFRLDVIFLNGENKVIFRRKMRTETKALTLGVVAGIFLLSLVVSMDFVYFAPRTAVAYVVNDCAANIALIPNDHSLQSQTGPFAYINSQGDLQINFGKVAPNSLEILSDVFFIKNNLNKPVTITLTVDAPKCASIYVYNTSVDDPPAPPPPPPATTPTPPPPPPAPTTITFQLGPGAEVPITLTIVTANVPPGTTLSFMMYVTATYMGSS
ncbi:hypothetical protein [Acidianus sp. HS-5]|uniref:hypothetical protein n=1 Tax=Acidianus sp. HS-5 TaxID=2886040 RepID=UPI001F260FAA|nr:hypothetical protein [Acidianus sp. HS-5]